MEFRKVPQPQEYPAMVPESILPLWPFPLGSDRSPRGRSESGKSPLTEEEHRADLRVQIAFLRRQIHMCGKDYPESKNDAPLSGPRPSTDVNENVHNDASFLPRCEARQSLSSADCAGYRRHVGGHDTRMGERQALPAALLVGGGHAEDRLENASQLAFLRDTLIGLWYNSTVNSFFRPEQSYLPKHKLLDDCLLIHCLSFLNLHSFLDLCATSARFGPSRQRLLHYMFRREFGPIVEDVDSAKASMKDYRRCMRPPYRVPSAGLRLQFCMFGANEDNVEIEVYETAPDSNLGPSMRQRSGKKVASFNPLSGMVNQNFTEMKMVTRIPEMLWFSVDVDDAQRHSTSTPVSLYFGRCINGTKWHMVSLQVTGVQFLIHIEGTASLSLTLPTTRSCGKQVEKYSPCMPMPQDDGRARRLKIRL